MGPARTCLLLSIKPAFAEAIFAGRKRVELRRTRPNVRPGDLVLVYVTVPCKELRGILRVACVAEAAPDLFWDQVQEQAGIEKEVFDEYFDGARNAFGIHFDEVHCFTKPVAAEELRREGWVDFQPPQSYRYLREHEIKFLERLLKLSLWNHPPRTGFNQARIPPPLVWEIHQSLLFAPT